MEIVFDIDKFYIDVRSESEYRKGHISGAVNLPILYDSERSEVGYLYKQVSVDQAKRRGIAFASEKLTSFFRCVQEYERQHGEENLVFYCSRGGYRSQSVQHFFEGLGIRTSKLSGGYKAYRNIVLHALGAPLESFPRFIGINGFTGTKKTVILSLLEEMGEPVLNLERAARHKGSNLGGIGMAEPQMAQQFENDLFHELVRAKRSGYCFVEMESKKIGSLLVPPELYRAYHEHPLAVVWIENEMEERIRFLLADYAENEAFAEEFPKAFLRIKQYLSQALYREILGHFEKGDLSAVARLLLSEYYDPLYARSTKSCRRDCTIGSCSAEEAALRIVRFKDHLLEAEAIRPGNPSE